MKILWAKIVLITVLVLLLIILAFELLEDFDPGFGATRGPTLRRVDGTIIPN